jgi:hypothetical protein
MHRTFRSQHTTARLGPRDCAPVPLGVGISVIFPCWSRNQTVRPCPCPPHYANDAFSSSPSELRNTAERTGSSSPRDLGNTRSHADINHDEHPHSCTLIRGFKRVVNGSSAGSATKVHHQLLAKAPETRRYPHWLTRWVTAPADWWGVTARIGRQSNVRWGIPMRAMRNRVPNQPDKPRISVCVFPHPVRRDHRAGYVVSDSNGR